MVTPTATIHHGDCIELMREMPDNSIDAIVTDPPYGLGFMGKAWDDLPPGLPWAQECLRVLKPGGHLLAFGGARTWHRLAVAVEDAGFEMRDSIAWLYGSGFPKSQNVGKQIDKRRDDSADRLAVGQWLRAQREAAGIKQKDVAAHWPSVTGGLTGCVANWEGGFSCPTWPQWLDLKRLVGLHDDMDAEVWRLNGRKGTPGEAWATAEVTGVKTGAMSGWNMDGTTKFVDREEKAPNSEAAAQWEGWGTALKPAFEPVVVARKPFPGTVAANVLAWGTGAINVDGCRIDGADAQAGRVRHGGGTNGVYASDEWTKANQATMGGPMPAGRWPANVVLDEGSAAELDEQSGTLTSGGGKRNAPKDSGTYGAYAGDEPDRTFDANSGGASRFFYCAKAPKRERPTYVVEDGRTIAHPTVKPLTLMRWLVRLVTPPGGTVMDTFAGSGATIEAALLEGFNAVGIEREAEYAPLIQIRIDRATVIPPASEPADLFTDDAA